MSEPLANSSGVLRPFDRLFAPTVAAWIQTPEQLRWLAPRTEFPLTPSKVVEWTRRSGQPYLFYESDEVAPCGYGELNPMKGDPSHQWIGHVVIDVGRRRQGLGRKLTNLLTRKAFGELGARKVSLVVFPDNKPALECYLRCGFKVVAEEFQRFDSRTPPQRMIRLGIVAAKR